MSQRTVYILGAGFSAGAGIPTQLKLIDKIIDQFGFDNEIGKFITKIFGLNAEGAKSLDLEDIYTPIHQCISKNEYLQDIPPYRLSKIENELNLLIAKVINSAEGDGSYIYEFARKIRDGLNDQQNGYSSIISLNWDIALDKILFELAENEQPSISVDYGCHATGFNYNDRIEPALVVQERLKYTNEQSVVFKLLKLHGSLGWGICPKCNRLVTHKKKKLGIEALQGSTFCPTCQNRLNRRIPLKSVLGLPSFQKDLDNFHFQHIWNQAAYDLSRADKVVFIGYSFPLADFDFRSLLTKHLGRDIEVEVVLYGSDGCENCDSTTRYKKYFGDKLKDENIFRDGAAHYIENNMGAN